MRKIGWVYVTYAIPVFLIAMLLVQIFYRAPCSSGGCRF